MTMSTTKSLKRVLPPKIARMKARKKQKISGSELNDIDISEKKGQASNKVVKLNDLRWKEVAPPDQMESYEGFFGLEEIDGVDVVRESTGSSVSYRVVNQDSRKKPIIESNDKPPDRNGKFKSSDSLSQADIEEEEWSGLDDATSSDEFETKAPQKKEIESASKSTKDPKNDENFAITNFSFSILDNETVDEGIDTDTSEWRSLRLSPHIMSGLARLNFSSPTMIQSKAIPLILTGRDLIGKAPTGSGKTLAFGIPIVQEWLASRDLRDSSSKAPIALIVLPTRELAHQITAHLTALCSKGQFDSPSIATLTGGLSIQKQRRLLENADLIVATPGRLWEVVSDGHGVLQSLKRIKYLVIDEADRLLTEGHFKDLEQLLTALDRKTYHEDEAEYGKTRTAAESQAEGKNERQTLVFSATFSKNLQQRLAKRSYSTSDNRAAQASMEYLLKKLNFREEKPVFIDINPVSQMAEQLHEALLECAGAEKDLYLYSSLLLYQERSINRALVFVNSISAVRRLVPFLVNLNMTAHPLHSQMAQKARLRSIERFTQQPSRGAASSSILVATDVAARGLDIPNVPLVIHYNVPRTADTYVHRSGRTARADKAGTSVLICAPSEAAAVRRLVAQVHGGSSGSNGASKSQYFLRSLDVDTRVVTRLRPRVVLAKRIADATGAKERKNAEDNWVKRAADELGVDVDDDFALALGGKKGRKKGAGRQKREEAARALSKDDMGALRAELRHLLSKRINIGVSERYLTSSGTIDIDALLKQRDAVNGGAGDAAAVSNGVGGAFLGTMGKELLS